LTLLGLDGSDRRNFAISGRSTTLGRQSDNDIALADPKVSRHHARVDFEDGQFVLTDLRSRNGTRLNGITLEQPRPMHEGDVIGIGLQELRFNNRSSQS
jgi:pSer/pThr/pTyr-binding forkhead associated (FHA) protein